MAQAFLVKRGTVATVTEEDNNTILDRLIHQEANIAGKWGVELLSTEIKTNAIDLSLKEFSADFEGFDIAINNLTIGLNYSAVFDFQFTDAQWFPSGQYMTGVTIRDTKPDIYNRYYYEANWYTWNSLPEGCSHYISDFNSETGEFEEPYLWTSESNSSGNSPGNIARDTIKHRHRLTFTATATAMYLSFNLCGCSDSYTNLFELTNFYVRETT